MEFINTHSHVYTHAFDVDRKEVVERAIQMGVSKILLPDIDASERNRVISLAQEFPEVCIPMFGIHPTSIKENYKDELHLLEQALSQQKVVAIGEIGIDLYWDKTFVNQQIEAFLFQMNLAKMYNVPVVIHVRNSFSEMFHVLDSIGDNNFKGVFHCFSGNLEQAFKVIDLGFLLGIGGVVTYKKSGLDDVVREISLEHIVLETDDPWLPPVPYRGKRNEPSFIIEVAKKVADIKECSVVEVARVTTLNAQKLFNF